jgi:NDP-sugar pyrophosphorylase family protein
MTDLAAMILSAGYGTRMGEVGQALPKPLWPLGERPLLEFVLRQLQGNGISSLWVNLHHQAHQVQQFLASLPFPVSVSEEPTLLGSGGGIHQMLALAQARSGLPTAVILANADQVVGWQQSPWPALQQVLATTTARAALLAIEVKQTQGFNRLVIEQGRLQAIRPWAADAAAPPAYLTYLGLGLLRPHGLALRPGEVSEFFHSVANYQQEEVAVCPTTPSFYYDCGTAAHYVHSLGQILELVATQPENILAQFLIKHHFVDPAKIQISSNTPAARRIFYGQVQAAAQVQMAINLTDHPIAFQQNAVVFASTAATTVEKAGIYYQNNFTPVENAHF